MVRKCLLISVFACLPLGLAEAKNSDSNTNWEVADILGKDETVFAVHPNDYKYSYKIDTNEEWIRVEDIEKQHPWPTVQIHISYGD